MILVCDACNARYLVPATAFAGGPRLVRCARCANTWMASLPPEPLQPATPPVFTPSPTVAAQVAAFDKKETMPVSQPLPTPKVEEPPLSEPPEALASIPAGSGLPALWKPARFNDFTRKLLIAVLASVLVWLLLLGVIARQGVLRRWPAMEAVYSIVGLLPAKPGDGLSLQNVRSERRFEDGAMQLIVAGDIRNDSAEIMKLPSIQALVFGADGQILYRWQIVPSVAKLEPSASLPFVSTVRSPSGAVSEINLSFIENEEHAD